MTNTFEKILKYFNKKIMLPQEVLETEQYSLLHISDTPSQIYKPLISLIEEIQPDTIVHSGDLADDIKLEMHPGELTRYSDTVAELLIPVIELTERLIVVPGNHDSTQAIQEISKSLDIIKPGSIVSIFDVTFGLSHDIKDLPGNAGFMLYGHNFEAPAADTPAIFLNGVMGINIILLPSCKVFSVPYPKGTDYYRKYNRCMKLT